MKSFFFVLIASLSLLIALQSCGSKADVVYQCPMECEGSKTYDKPGKCPVCGMDLKEISKSEVKKEGGNESEEHNHEHNSGDSSHTHPH